MQSTCCENASIFGFSNHELLDALIERYQLMLK
jgi:hypothetical protein